MMCKNLTTSFDKYPDSWSGQQRQMFDKHTNKHILWAPIVFSDGLQLFYLD